MQPNQYGQVCAFLTYDIRRVQPGYMSKRCQRCRRIIRQKLRGPSRSANQIKQRDKGDYD